MKHKQFYQILTVNGRRLINVNEIATIEEIANTNETLIIMRTRNDKGQNVWYRTKIPYNDITLAINSMQY